MKCFHFFGARAILFGLFTICGAFTSIGGEVTRDREVTFELTFANRDVTWLGDPASPTAAVYPKPRALPVARDVCVRTLITDSASPQRRYFREARIVEDGGARKVLAFTKQREKLIGHITAGGRFAPNDFYRENRALLPSWPEDVSGLAYDAEENALYVDVDLPGPLVSESLDFLPLDVIDANGLPLKGRYSIGFAPSSGSGEAAKRATVALVLRANGESIVLAVADVPQVFRGEDVQIESYNNRAQTYFPESAYRAGADTTTANNTAEPCVTVTFAGEFTTAVPHNGERLIVIEAPSAREASDNPYAAPPKITIDGQFDDWRNVPGVDDPRGDLVPYLEYVPDVDLLEFKVAHDDQHIYLYARVAGKVGRSHPDGGRAYFYAYMDVDQNPGTGFLPTRDDDCYFGVEIGDDCEVQFEFVNNALRKTFYGFCGIGGNDNVLKQIVTIGKSQYGRFDENGVERANYKSEYVYKDGVTEITEDLKLGTSDTIHIAVSPDGHEVEVVSDLSGFLKNARGEPTVRLGQTIDVAAGMECDSKLFPGKSSWAADSTAPIRGYRLVPISRVETD